LRAFRLIQQLVQRQRFSLSYLIREISLPPASYVFLCHEFA